MSPALAKAMGGSHAKALAKKEASASLHQSNFAAKPQEQRRGATQPDMQADQIPQQLMRPPSPLMSQQVPTHPNDQAMVEGELDKSEEVEDERMKAEKDILNTHLEAVREEAQLIQREGEMITTCYSRNWQWFAQEHESLGFNFGDIQNDQDYDMREYLADARQIAARKFQLYG